MWLIIRVSLELDQCGASALGVLTLVATAFIE
jgi:hypothetical protein